MHIDNITSENMVLTNDGKAMQISIYEKEIDRLNNIINELEKEFLKKLEAVKYLKNTLGDDVYVLNPHINLLEKEYNYFLDKLKELKEENK